MWTAIVEGEKRNIIKSGRLTGPNQITSNIQVTDNGDLSLLGLGITLTPDQAPIELPELGVRIEYAEAVASG